MYISYLNRILPAPAYCLLLLLLLAPLAVTLCHVPLHLPQVRTHADVCVYNFSLTDNLGQLPTQGVLQRTCEVAGGVLVDDLDIMGQPLQVGCSGVGRSEPLLRSSLSGSVTGAPLPRAHGRVGSWAPAVGLARPALKTLACGQQSCLHTERAIRQQAERPSGVVPQERAIKQQAERPSTCALSSAGGRLRQLLAVSDRDLPCAPAAGAVGERAKAAR